MRHTAATVFSDRDGAIGFAPPPPPRATGVNTIWPLSGRCCIVQGAPSSLETTSSNDWSRRALCCLDLTWEKGLLPLDTTATRHENKTTLEKNMWWNIAGDFIL